MNDQSDDELLDLVNNNDEVIGAILKSDYDPMVEGKLGYIRTAELLIENDEGRFWIPTRTADKKIAPSGFDFSAAGHVGSGEDYMTAVLREIHEEINLELKSSDLTLLKKFSPGTIPYFRCVYVYQSNESPTFNPNDFTKAEWLSIPEILDKIRSGTPAKTALLETVRALSVTMA